MLVHDSGRNVEQIGQALGAPLRLTDVNDGLSPREERAAAAGIDLGLQ